MRNDTQEIQSREVSEEWGNRRVSQMGSVLAGKALDIGGAGSLRPYLRTKNVLDGRIDLRDVLWMPMTDAEFDRFSIVDGDVLLNEGQSLELVGRCSIYRGEYGAACAMQNQLLRFRAFDGTSADFAAHLFRFCQQAGKFSAIATQTTSVAHLGSSRFSNLELLWPADRNEQDGIADALTDADKLIYMLEHAIAKKRAIEQGMLQQLLTGRTRLPGFAGPWREVCLGDVLAVRHGKSQKAVEDGAGKYPILASGGQIGWAKMPLYSKPSVLIGRKGTIDRPQYQTAPFWTVDTLFYTEISEQADPRYLYFLFLTVDWRSMNEGSGVPSLSSRNIEGLEFRLPEIDEQRAIRSVLDDAYREINVLQDRLNKAHAIKHGMMQQLLTGRTRLPV